MDVALPVIRSDPRHLELVFFHLIQNAMLYRADDRAPRIAIGGEDGADVWQFCVADNGMGVPSLALEKVFKPLRRAVGNAYPGVGMGLAIAKKVVQRNGGQIGVEAGPEVGSRFHFTLAKRG
ncbi:MAG: ATP-binding protein [Pseudomonadota bacterium]